ncbi:hypothetical protein D6774_03235 [Candidatus Woesearchaeota archaeon]|nr:MAG: hypothetical protein D6774_03235 [Candidatus Woesearchaeota archaeon]
MSETRELGSVNLTYEGIFDFKELYRLVDDFARTKNYGKNEKVNKEIVHEDGKDIQIVLEIQKEQTDYVAKKLKIVFDAKNVKDVEVNLDGKKLKMHKGTLFFSIKGYLITDWEGKWEATPWQFFIRAVYDKWIYKKETQDFAAEVKADMNFLRDQVRAYLNLTRMSV